MEKYSVTDIKSNGDFDKISKIEKEAFATYVNYWNKDTFKKISADSKYVIKILKNSKNKIIGYIVFFIIDIDIAELHKIVIDKNNQGQGLSKYLFKQVLILLNEKKITKIILEVMIDNTSAIGLYKSLGFIQIGIRKNYYKVHIDKQSIEFRDALVMELSFEIHFHK